MTGQKILDFQSGTTNNADKFLYHTNLRNALAIYFTGGQTKYLLLGTKSWAKKFTEQSPTWGHFAKNFGQIVDSDVAKQSTSGQKFMFEKIFMRLNRSAPHSPEDSLVTAIWRLLN